MKRSFFSECTLTDGLAAGQRALGAGSREGSQRTPVPSRNLDAIGEGLGGSHMDTS